MKPTYFDWGVSAEKPFVAVIQHVKPLYNSNMDYDFHRSVHVNVVLEGDYGCEIGNTSIQTNRGECLLTAPWEPHRGVRSEVGATVCMIALSLDEVMKNLLADGEKLTSLLMLPPRIRHDLLRKKNLMRFASICGQTIQTAGVGNTLRGWQALINFFIELVCGLDKEDIPEEPQSDYIRLRPALQMINAGKGVIVAAEAARACNLSVSRFRALFRQVFRKSFASYELQYRLNCAADDILKSRLTVKDAAFEWGFFDASHFSRLFKRSFGISPGKYGEIHTHVP